MHIIPIRIIFATSIKHTTKIMLLVDTSKYRNTKIINKMEESKITKEEFEQLFAQYLDKNNRESLSKNQLVKIINYLTFDNMQMQIQTDELKSELQKANKKIEELEVEKADLRKRKDEILSSWSNERDKNIQLQNSLNAVATLINTILA